MSTCSSVSLEWDSVQGANSYLVGDSKVLDGNGAERPAALLSTPSTAIKVTGLRASTRYAFLVAARGRDGRQSAWTTATAVTEPPTMPPQTPAAPKATRGSGCDQLSLHLPEPAGCRAPEEYSLQYLPDPAGQWLDHQQHIRTPALNVTGLRRGGTYEFRLIASNEVGSSDPGASTGPWTACSSVPSRVETVGSEDSLIGASAPSGHTPSSVVGVAVAAALLVAFSGGLLCWLRTRCTRRDARGRYVRAEISAEQWTVAADEDGAEPDPCLRVLFQTPGSTTSLQADVSTQGFTSVPSVLRQLCDVFKELHGQEVPSDALVVKYEDARGDLMHMHSASTVKDLLGARRIVVSVRPRAQRATSYAF